MVMRDEELNSRARKWIRRELQAIDSLNGVSVSDRSADQTGHNSEFLLEYVMAILTTIDLKGCNGQAEELLQDFLGRSIAVLFLHELKAWLRSPYNDLLQWDQHVQYPKRSRTSR